MNADKAAVFNRRSSAFICGCIDSTPAPEVLHDPVGLPVGLGYPLLDPAGLRCILQLDRDYAVVAGLPDGPEVVLNGRDAPAWGQVAVGLAVAVRQVDVLDQAPQACYLLDLLADK